ncbi:hypothetical protein BC828DRAFT_406453 [Blastocladiella britannica]|nr:hypothetical protein BC828DRAFT_406453 [Blastocladiella britannica]
MPAPQPQPPPPPVGAATTAKLTTVNRNGPPLPPLTRKRDLTLTAVSLGHAARDPIQDVVVVHGDQPVSSHRSPPVVGHGTPAIVVAQAATTGLAFQQQGSDHVHGNDGGRAEQHHMGVCEHCRGLLHSVYAHCFDPTGQIDAALGAAPSPHHLHPHAQQQQQQQRLLPSPNTIHADRDAIAQSPVPAALKLMKVPSPVGIMHAASDTGFYVDPLVSQFNTAQSSTATARANRRDALLRKFGLAIKDQEIQRLRGALTSERVHNQHVAMQVSQLQTALKSTVVFAQTAEEWQQGEAARLVEDVEGLKEQIAAIMVMFIHSEEEKSEIKLQLQQAQTEILTRDTAIATSAVVIREQQDKLHDAYKEYLDMNGTIDRLEKEAVEGSGAARARADVLSQHLDRMSRDFDSTSRALITAQERARQLEFELGAVITQFNETGDVRHALQKAYDETSERFAELDARHLQLTAAHDEAMGTIRGLKVELENEKKAHEAAVGAKVAELRVQQKRADDLQSAKAQVEGIVARLKAESEKLRESVIELRSSRSDVEAALSKLQQKYDEEVRELTVRATQAASHATECQSELTKTTDQRERLQIQVNELRSNLDRERTRATAFDRELKALKESSSIAQADFETQVATLTVTKTNLAADKKELMETLSKARRDLIEKKVALEDIVAKMEAQTATQVEEVSTLTANIASLQDALKTMTAQYTQLVGNHRAIKETHDQLEIMFASASTAIAERSEQLRLSQARVADLEATQVRLESELAVERDSLLVKLGVIDALENNIKELEGRQARLAADWSRRDFHHDENRKQLEAALASLREQYRTLHFTHEQALAAHNRTKQDLGRTRDALLEESAARSLLEMAVDDLRSRYDGERRARVDYERLGFRLEKRASAWVGSKLDAWLDREQVWQDLDEWMQSEANRLDECCTLLGLEDLNAEGMGTVTRGRSSMNVRRVGTALSRSSSRGSLSAVSRGHSPAASVRRRGR